MLTTSRNASSQIVDPAVSDASALAAVNVWRAGQTAVAVREQLSYLDAAGACALRCWKHPHVAQFAQCVVIEISSLCFGQRLHLRIAACV